MKHPLILIGLGAVLLLVIANVAEKVLSKYGSQTAGSRPSVITTHTPRANGSSGISYSSSSTPELLEWTPRFISVKPGIWSDSIPREGPGKLDNFTLPPDLIARVTIKNAVTGTAVERDLFPQGGMFPAGWEKVKLMSKDYGVEITLMVQNPLPPR